VKKQKRLKNYITFVLDNSGSMASIGKDVMRTYNSLTSGLRQQSEKNDQEKLYSDASVEALVPLTSYPTDDLTALWDAVGDAIDNSQSMKDAAEGHVSHLIYILTDGLNNASMRHNVGSITRLMSDLMHDGNWTFVYQMPPGAKANFVRTTGIPEGNVAEWEATTRGVEVAYAAASAGFSGFYEARTKGATFVNDFFVKTDLSKLKKEDLWAKLKDVQKDFMSITVSREMEIKEFVEENTNQPYRLGDAFYQLSKTEKIQAGKDLMIMEKGKRGIWAGAEARELVGIPVGSAGKVTPGNHSNFDIFVQSTSTNRKLVRGTRVLVRK
jgi:hypothetical protein